MEILDIQGLFLYAYIIPNYAYFYKGIHTLPSSSTSGFDNGDNFNEKMNNGTHTNSTLDTLDTNTGSFYTWCSATAKNCTKVSVSNGNVSEDLCPNNWHLPAMFGVYGQSSTNSTQGELLNLSSKIAGFVMSYNSPKKPPAEWYNSWPTSYAGCYYTSSRYHYDQYSFWWTSTRASASGAYYMRDLKGSGIDYFNNVVGSGFSIRCLAK